MDRVSKIAKRIQAYAGTPSTASKGTLCVCVCVCVYLIWTYLKESAADNKRSGVG